MIRSVEKFTATLIPPLVPAGTTAAFARMDPDPKFRVETTGAAAPVGNALRNPPDGVPTGATTVKFSENATAPDAIPAQLGLEGIRNERAAPPPTSCGGPKVAGNPALRVSAMRHGENGMKMAGAPTSANVDLPVEAADHVGGADQFRSGMSVAAAAVAHRATTASTRTRAIRR